MKAIPCALLTGSLVFGAVQAVHAAQDTATAKAAAPQQTSQQQTKPSNSASSSGAVRDWTQVDTNKDGSVSPTEMETYLNNNPGPLHGS